MSSDFTIAELEDAIKRLRNKKAPGKDGVCNEMIRHLGKTAKQKLLELFNQSWTTGIFPTAWKEATIIPILKKGKDPKRKTSYRPISLLSCLGKTLERMVNKRLMWHLESNNLITKEQTAFRKNRNTEDQLIHLAQSIENAFQDGHKVVATFIDLTKAFDKVWKQGLLLKLLTAGVNGNMFKWIKSFLSHRTGRVKLNGTLSHKVTLLEGVPQGGVISPTLFIVYINDITKGLSTHTSRALHADDFAMWTSAKSTDTAKVRMQDALDNTSKWADDWCVTINSLKTVATCFSLSNKSEKIQMKIKNRKVPMDDTPTYLGIKLDKRLTWNPQIHEMEKRATNRLSLIKKTCWHKVGCQHQNPATGLHGKCPPSDGVWISSLGHCRTNKHGKIGQGAKRKHATDHWRAQNNARQHPSNCNRTPLPDHKATRESSHPTRKAQKNTKSSSQQTAT